MEPRAWLQASKRSLIARVVPAQWHSCADSLNSSLRPHTYQISIGSALGFFDSRIVDAPLSFDF